MLPVAGYRREALFSTLLNLRSGRREPKTSRKMHNLPTKDKADKVSVGF